MNEFVYVGQASRVIFGRGALDHLERELVHLGARRALVLSTPGQREQAERVARRLGDRSAGVFARASMHVPAPIARDAIDEARRLGCDCAVAVGGGSTIGLGKAIALDTGLPILAVPTTYSGSEMTPIYGITEGGAKTTGRDARVLPRTVIYDPDLTLELPVALSMSSGMNAIAHAAEGLYARDSNPVMSFMAQEGIRALATALPSIQRRSDDVEARGSAMYGAWLCGMVLGSVGMALHHKLCHTLGGTFGLPHSDVHAVVLPHAIAFNALAAPNAMHRIKTALGPRSRSSAAAALFDLAEDLKLPTTLGAIGMRESDLERAAGLAVANPYWNPRAIDEGQRDGLLQLLRNAFVGRRPE